MKLFKHVLDFYINSSIHVALSVFCLSYITLIEFGVSYDKNVLLFIFFATITGYNFVKYFGLAKFHYRRLSNWLRIIQMFSFVCFVFLCVFAFKLQSITVLYIAGFGIVTFFYAIPFLPKRIFLDEHQNLRSISGLKIYVIALVWSGVTVFLPLINNDFAMTTDVFITALQRFLFVIVLMLPFEIRDLQYDSIKLSTIPQKTGEKYTKIIGVLLLIVFFCLEYFKDEMVSKQTIILFIITFLTLLFLMFARKNQRKYYSGYWVESIPIIWLLLTIIG
jgi:hypothetical protein